MSTARRSCSNCGAVLGDGDVCPKCGTQAQRDAFGRDPTVGADAFLPTALANSPSAARTPAPAPDDELESGRVVAGRYRIVRPLGKGGMGEVVLARDLELDQQVALKFLPLELQGDAGHLARLREEVKLARRVSHPNVCRVHDLGEVRGRPFLTMEYVDGEDLGALLRRIGRLPPEKAVELAHQLCSGLHAAHEQGILHRDLKPANVMIDGEGRLKITDFGLAALAHEVGGARVREGTPAYMAPEQLAGAEVTRKSDIYALGLVLYELFTGKRAHAGERRRDTRPASPSTLLDAFDPAIERVIMRCLEPEPDDRPASVLAVAAGLPGGDPIGAALAAGELPTPEMVAASGESGTLRSSVAIVLLALVLVPIFVLGILFEGSSLLGRLPDAESPEVLAHAARELAEELDARPTGESAHWFEVDTAVLRHLSEQYEEDGESAFEDPPSHPLRLVWRAGPGMLVSRDPLVAEDEPPFREPGSVIVRLDARGRLVQWRRIPPVYEHEIVDADEAAAWPVLVERAGLVFADLAPTPAQLVPREYADRRLAWTGAWSDGTPVRIEAASLHGRPVAFTVLGPWDDEIAALAAGPAADGESREILVGTRAGTRVAKGFEVVLVVLLMIGVVLIFVVGLLMAIRSLRRGEGDRRTAARVALFVTLSSFVAAAIGGHANGLWLLRAPVFQLPFALLEGVAIWLAYIAIEPYARRFWPHALVSWSRFVRGRWRDPLVGRDLLVGTACASTLILAVAIASQSTQPSRLDIGDQHALLGARHAMAELVGLLPNGLTTACAVFMAVLVTRLVLRRQWATLVATLVVPVVVMTTVEPSLASLIAGLAFGISLAVVIFRAGLLGAIAWATVFAALEAFPWTLDASAWYAGVGSLGGLAVAALAVASFWIALGGRSVLGEGFFGR